MHKRNLFIVLLLVLVTGFNSKAQSCYSERYQKEIFTSQVTPDIYFATADPYGISSSQDLRMDIYEPIGDTASFRPLIVYAFGGAFLIGDKRQPDIPLYCNHFAKQGFVVASIDYRIGFNTLSTGSAVRAVYRGIQDIRAAVRFLCQNQSTYRIDTNFIIFSGSSAGCISSIHASYLTDADRPSYTYAGAVLLEPEDMGCSDCSGNALYGLRIPKPAAIINRWGAILDTSYISNLQSDSIPMISFHGTADPAVPYGIGTPFSFPIFPSVMGSSIIHQQLTSKSIYNKLVPLVGAGHEPELLEPRWDDTIFQYCNPFLYQILKPYKPSIMGNAWVCAGDTHIYSVPYKNRHTYCWTLDSSTILVQNIGNTIKVIFTDTGLHTIQLRVYNQIQCMGDSVFYNIYAVAPPEALFSVETNELQCTFTNNSIHAGNYTWYFDDGTSSNAIAPIHNYSDTGEYTIILVANNGVCNDTFKQTIRLTRCPVASFNQVISANHIYLYNTSLYADSIAWFIDSMYWGSSTDTFIECSTEGNYQITLQAFYDTICHDTETSIVDIEFNTLPAFYKNDIRIYPNPTIDFFILQTPINMHRGKLLVKDIVGKIYKEQVIQAGLENISISNLPSGMYMILIESESLKYQLKLVKQ